ncbi:MAG: hypothetical protein HQ581_21235, partial [Planctomycetes bacterium]|nr:hypothetical protein [Planctomycetota bacterium]
WLCSWSFQSAVANLTNYLGNGPGTVAQSGGSSKTKIVASYDYRDERGELLYQVVRFDPKDFRQRRPKAGGGWEWAVKGTRMVPYRLSELSAADPACDVFIVEGEKDADRAVGIGIVATTCAMGAGKWRSEYSEHFRNRRVCIIPDNDESGREHATQVARSLCGIADSIKVVDLPGVADKGDLSDWLDQGHTYDDLAALAEAVPEWFPAYGDEQPEPAMKPMRPKNRQTPSQATALVALVVRQGPQLWHTPEGIGHITVPAGGHAENWPLRSAGFRRWLQREFFVKTEAAVNAQAMQDAIGVLEGKAIFDGQQHDAHMRVAEHWGSIYIDLADPDWRVVEIDARGWRVLAKSPVKFRRCRAMLPLPTPAPGDIAELRHHLGLCEEGWPLVAGWMVAALRPSGPFPILNLYAEQGAGKTTIARKIRELADPNTAPVRCEPKEPRDLMIAANNGWVIALDNLSRISPWLSDALCRLSTGGGFSTRELYSDAEEVIFDAKRPVILTGIEELATRGDLLDRSLIVNLPNIPEARRRPESDIWREFDQARPRLLGVLCDAVSAALQNLSNTKMAKLPRMADFAIWATAAEPAIGLKGGEFLAAYEGNRAAGNELALEASSVGKVVLDFVAGIGVWTGTASELLAELDELADEKTKRLKSWPQTPRSLSNVLKRLAPNLRAVGVEVESGRTGRGRWITLRKEGESSVTSITTLENHGDSDDQGDARVTQNPAGVTQENPENDAGDAGDDEIPSYSADVQRDLSPEQNAAVEEFLRS